MSEAHDNLVAIAAEWLKAQRCSVVLTELPTSALERPDAIGWQATQSILVECKVTRADFRADAAKLFRLAPENGVGLVRYFLTPPGLIRVEELSAKWGLLEWDGTRVRRVRKSEWHAVDNRQEIALLLSAVKRIGVNCPEGISVRCYTMRSGNRSTLGVESLEESALLDGDGI